MKDWKELTKEEFELLKEYKTKTDFDKNSMMSVVNLTRQYVDPRVPDCLSCSGSFRDTINKLRSFYLLHKDEWELQFEAVKVAEEIHKPKANGKTKNK